MSIRLHPSLAVLLATLLGLAVPAPAASAQAPSGTAAAAPRTIDARP